MSNFYIDLVSGNDANDGLGPYKAAYTSGGTTAIAVGDTVTGGTSGKTAKVVYITVTSGSWAGGDAAGSIYVGTPSGAFTNGEALLVGGSDLATLTADFAANAWLTVASGATAARTAPGDEIRFKKGTAATDLGGATVAYGSKSLVFGSAKWANICDCESNWTASANITRNVNNSPYNTCQGTYSVSLAVGSAFTTGKMAYFDFGAGNERNLSGYTGISFSIGVSANQAAGIFRVDLCSDATGDVPVNSFTINKKLMRDSTYSWYNFVWIDSGGALGSSIRSISITALSDPGTPTIYIDNFVAVNSNIHHGCMVGESADSLRNAIKCFGTDGVTATLIHSWRGTANPASVYSFTDFVVNDSATNYNTTLNVIQEGGTSASALIKYRGGWNFSTDAQDGYTGLRQINWACGIVWSASGKGYLRWENFLISGGYQIFVGDTNCNRWELKNIFTAYTTNSFSTGGQGYCLIEGILATAGGGALYLGSGNTMTSTYSGQLDITADVYFNDQAATLSGPIVFQYGGIRCTGTIYSEGTAEYGIQFAKGCSGFFNKIVSNVSKLFYLNGCAYVDIAHVENKYSSALLLVGGSDATTGIVRIGRLTNSGSGSFHANWNDTSVYVLGASARACVDSIDDDATKFLIVSGGGIGGDHVTMGQVAGWGYGGTGKSLLLSPTYQSPSEPLRYVFYIPAAASTEYKLSMQVKKTSSGASCTLTYDIHGCGITPVVSESVTLTDSWAEHLTGSSFTTTVAGMLRVVLQMYDGGTTGDIGIDEIKLTEI